MSASTSPLIAAVFDNLPDGVFLLDPQTSNILDCNEGALRQIGMDRNEVLNHSVLSLQKDVVGMPAWASIAQAIREADGYVFVGQHRHKHGYEVPVEVNTSCFVHDGREYFLSIARDIRQRLAVQDELDKRDVQLRYALTDASDGLWDWNLQTDEVFFSPQLKRMLGYGPNEMKPTLDTWADNIHPEDGRWVRRAINEHIAGLRERFDAEYRLRNRNGHYLWVHDRGRVCAHDAQGQPLRVVGMVENVTDRKNTELRLQQMASNDVLTGVLNRRECERVLPQQLELCRRLGVPLGVCLFDLDHFKDINDRCGHSSGDDVLRTVAQAVRAQLRSTDYLFRWGGDEFLLVCTDTPLADLQLLAEKLRSSVADLPWPDTSDIGKVTCSFGVSVCPDFAANVEDLFMSADSALYRAKAQGRNRVEVPPASA